MSPAARLTLQPRWVEIFVVTFLAAVLLALATFTLADPDLWGHLRFGLDIIERGQVHTKDPYSFTSDRPWINHEWLAEVAFGLSYRAAGVQGLLLLKLLLIGATALIAYRTIRLGADPVHSRLLALLPLGALVPIAQTIRPQLFSILAFATMVRLVLRYRMTLRPKYLCAIPPLFCLWANAHGGWVLGGATLGALLVAAAAQASTRQRALLGATLTAAAAAPLLNPYGAHLYVFLLETLRAPRPEITEWQGILGGGWADIGLWLAMAAFTGYWFAKGYWRRHPQYALVIVVFAVLSFNVIRLIGFAALLTALLLSVDGHRNTTAGIRTRTRRLSTPELAVLAVATIACLALSFSHLRYLKAAWLPPAGDVAYIRAALPSGRILSWFNWGQYAIWHLGPQVQVSFDGRRETVYSHQFIRDHIDLYATAPSWRKVFDRMAPDLVWLPTTVPLAAALTSEGWHVLRRTPESVILGRNPPDHEPSAPTATSATGDWRRFPEP